MLRSKKNSYKEFDNEKNSCGSKISHPPPTPPPPHNFFDGPSLITPPNFTQNDLCATSAKNTNLYMYKK